MELFFELTKKASYENDSKCIISCLNHGKKEPKLGNLNSEGGDGINADQSFLTTASVLFDAVYQPSGRKSIDALKDNPDARHFILEAYMHCKPIGADGVAVELVKLSLSSKPTAY